jgi:hypothetical protein
LYTAISEKSNNATTAIVIIRAGDISRNPLC